jgi:hypothetical protein
MVIYKKAPELSVEKRTKQATKGEVKKVTIRVALDEQGNLRAAEMGHGATTDGEEDELMRNIIEAIESHLNLPPGKLSISGKRPEAYLN